MLATGLHQLGGQCEKISGELTAAAAPRDRCLVVAVQRRGGVRRAAAAGKDLGAIAGRVGSRSAGNHTADTATRRFCTTASSISKRAGAPGNDCRDGADETERAATRPVSRTTHRR